MHLKGIKSPAFKAPRRGLGALNYKNRCASLGLCLPEIPENNISKTDITIYTIGVLRKE
jgi:hypothetical protein